MTDSREPPAGPNVPPYLKCPGCQQLPHMVISEVQALCGSGDCPVLFFNPSMADGGLAEAQLLNLDWAVPASAEELRARMPNPRPLDPEGPA